MNKIKVKDIVLETGRPKIAVPITGTAHDSIIEDVKEIIKSPCDIMEWRADYYFGEIENLEEKVDNTEAHRQMIRILDDIDYLANDRPLIFTIRGHGHGGRVAISREHAFDLSSLAAQSKLVDFVDMELFDDDDTYDEQQVIRQIEEIHGFGVRVILSFHDYDTMLTNEQITNVATLMRDLGADVVKIACMAHTQDEARNMLNASAALTKGSQSPVILIAMGEAGIPSRILGGKYGSCITFAKGRKATAKGQLSAVTLSKYLDKYYAE